MSERASIRFYDVKHCGLYKPRGRHCTLGSFSEILHNIYNWAREPGRLILNTCSYEVNEEFDQEFLETYLVSAQLHAENGDYLFCFWNRTHATGDSVYALDASAQLTNVSENVFHQGNLPASSIPGFATYFWFIPSRSVMATITFGNPRSGMNAFSYWLESFFRTESRYASFDQDCQFKGYLAADGTIHEDLEPRFTKQLYRNPSKRELILSNCNHIRGLTRRINLERSQITDKDLLDRLKCKVGISTDTEVDKHDISLKYEFSYTPTENEIREIFDAYESSNSRSNWEDVGFIFPDNNGFGAEKTEWLSKSFAKIKLVIDIEWVLTGQLVRGEILLQTLSIHRADLLNLLESNVTNLELLQTV
ncbi:hypothetical protein L1D24_12150 [Vibrio brasiliensis]|uniref:hypothetical protein n=1 Tax=Vibrio brasiliensis TaxID=170652 RepID=UPI001EFE5CC8|nr:hypothetical protein [Vibrio brasiliensis]MCG9649317.1 hypothetical protein [Vibrio brasiliensis]